MSARSILLLLSCLLLAAASLAWWHLPRLWPRGVVAHSPLLGPAIRAEAYRWAGSAISHRDWAAYVSLDQRLDADPAAGAAAVGWIRWRRPDSSPAWRRRPGTAIPRCVPR